jgi:hypothetical protein
MTASAWSDLGSTTPSRSWKRVAYQALTSERPYHPAQRSEHALEIIRGDVPRRRDPEAVLALQALLR